MCELKYWIALSCTPGIGSCFFFHLVERLGSPEKVWHADEDCLRAALEARPGLVEQLLRWRAHTDPDSLERRLQSLGMHAVAYNDPHYPRLLKQTSTPPPVLYYVGSLPGDQDVCVSVVGTRKPTQYGSTCATEIAAALAQAGFWVVSGMAIGIDSCAHRAALDVGGRTVAVLGSGPDVIYPRQNRALYGRITRAGAVVSEYYPGTPPLRTRFPARNRIVSGMSVATVIVQAGKKSGALHTARFASEQGRSVYVVPGDIHCHASVGSNRLLYDGATPVISVDQLIEDISATLDAWQIPRPSPVADLDSRRPSLAAPGNNSSKVLFAVQQGNATVNAIARAAQMDVSDVLVELVLLELEGKVIRNAAGAFEATFF